MWVLVSLLNSFFCSVNKTQNSGFKFQYPFNHWLLVPQAEPDPSSSGFTQHHCFPATPLCGWFPGGLEGEESTCNVGDPGSIPGLGRSPGEGNGYPLHFVTCVFSFQGSPSLSLNFEHPKGWFGFFYITIHVLLTMSGA